MSPDSSLSINQISMVADEATACAKRTRTHTRVKTREGVKLSRRAAVKTTGVESLCSATPGIYRVPRIVVSHVNFKTEKETKIFLRHIFLYIYQ